MTIQTPGEEGPVVVLPPESQEEQKWFVRPVDKKTALIETAENSRRYLSFDGEATVNSQIDALAEQPREWEIRNTTNPDHSFIVLPGLVNDEELAVDFSLLRIYPPRLALRPLDPTSKTQIWTFPSTCQ